MYCIVPIERSVISGTLIQEQEKTALVPNAAQVDAGRHRRVPWRWTRAEATRAMTSSQLPGRCCRKIRIEGYHGESSRSSIQSHAVAKRYKCQTGVPSAP